MVLPITDMSLFRLQSVLQGGLKSYQNCVALLLRGNFPFWLVPEPSPWFWYISTRTPAFSPSLQGDSDEGWLGRASDVTPEIAS